MLHAEVATADSQRGLMCGVSFSIAYYCIHEGAVLCCVAAAEAGV